MYYLLIFVKNFCVSVKKLANLRKAISIFDVKFVQSFKFLVEFLPCKKKKTIDLKIDKGICP